MIETYMIRRENFILIPMAYNSFCYDVKCFNDADASQTPISLERILNADDIKMAGRMIRNLKKEDENDVFIIDMQDIRSCAERILGELLILKDLHIFITHANNLVKKQAMEELKGSFALIDGGKVVALHADDEMLYQKISGEADRIWESEADRISKWMIKFIGKDDLKTLLPVASSGIYCNIRVNMKKLFMNPDRLLCILYLMTKETLKYVDKVDALICPSRNGANLAALIGRLLHKKVCYCETVGPKFSLALPEVKKEIQEGTKYLVIYDFICLGTEIKLLNAIVGVMGAEIVAGVGIANYAKLDGQQGIMGKMKSLVDLRKDGICRIAGTLEEIGEMLKEEVELDEPGIFRVQMH